MSEHKLKMYMGYSHDAGSEEGACLIFAVNSDEARKLSFPLMKDWHDSDWTDARVSLIKGQEFLYKEANQEKLNNGISHLIDSPTACNNCNQWGQELDEKGLCEGCADDEIQIEEGDSK